MNSISRFLLLVLVAACAGGTEEPVGSDDYRSIDADQILYGVEQYVTTSGQRRAIVSGDTTYIYEDSSRARLAGNVKVTLYDEQGNETAQVTAREGLVNTANQSTTARGNVLLVVRSDGSTIETEELHYDPNTHRVWSTVPTTRKQPDGSVLTGTGFTADDKFQEVRVANATGTGTGLKF